MTLSDQCSVTWRAQKMSIQWVEIIDLQWRRKKGYTGAKGGRRQTIGKMWWGVSNPSNSQIIMMSRRIFARGQRSFWWTKCKCINIFKTTTHTKNMLKYTIWPIFLNSLNKARILSSAIDRNGLLEFVKVAFNGLEKKSPEIFHLYVDKNGVKLIINKTSPAEISVKVCETGFSCCCIIVADNIVLKKHLDKFVANRSFLFLTNASDEHWYQSIGWFNSLPDIIIGK